MLMSGPRRMEISIGWLCDPIGAEESGLGRLSAQCLGARNLLELVSSGLGSGVP